MRIVFTNEAMTQAVVRRRTFPIFGTMVEAVVELRGDYWRFATSGDPVPYCAPLSTWMKLGDRLDHERNMLKSDRDQRAITERNWRPAPGRAVPDAAAARLVKS